MNTTKQKVNNTALSPLYSSQMCPLSSRHLQLNINFNALTFKWWLRILYNSSKILLTKYCNLCIYYNNMSVSKYNSIHIHRISSYDGNCEAHIKAFSWLWQFFMGEEVFYIIHSNQIQDIDIFLTLTLFKF